MTTSYDYFDRMYQDPDPWEFETSAYERHKYATTIASLPRERYRRAFEPGCSIGVLTAELALRADELVATDIHPRPLVQARARLAPMEGVTVEQLHVPDAWPAGTFDLVVLSEIAYYFDDVDLERLMDRVAASLEPDGDLVLVHWRGETDYPQTGDHVHDRWLDRPGYQRVHGVVEEEFRLDVLRATPLLQAPR